MGGATMNEITLLAAIMPLLQALADGNISIYENVSKAAYSLIA